MSERYFSPFIRSRVRMHAKMDRWIYKIIIFEGARKMRLTRHTRYFCRRCLGAYFIFSGTERPI